ncbi:hypothetical protein [Paraburkholderia tuberum]|uniref:Uncharacterized protein n=1 Tax=Paraburkholderia tuberum TaxID=157910 RepID=A0A1H1KGS3_9BURK|nr:hypothetical protein [Paraburkholderia tuberum]SDR61180.1 hypothetical protein SAMN05445850_7600 [Paraburkholderia tuberum]
MLDTIRADRNLIAHQALVCQGNDLAEIIGAEPVSLRVLKEIDRRALKAMTALVCEYIRTTPKNSA